MSWQATKAVWEYSKQTGYGKLLMLALAEFADAEGRCWPAIETLAKRIDVSERSVKRLIAQAESDGELTVCRNAGRGNTNEYIISFAVKGDTAVTINDSIKGDTTAQKGDTAVIKGDTSVRKGDTPVTQNHQEPSNNHQEPSNTPVPKKQTAKAPLEFDIPEKLNTPEFKQAFTEDWPAARQEQRKKLTQRAVNLQLKELARYSPAVATAMVKQSIMNQWTGIFPLKDGSLLAQNGSNPGNGTAVHHALKTREIKQVQGEF